MRSSGVFPSGVEVNATLLDPKTPQELENRLKRLRFDGAARLTRDPEKATGLRIV
jgi:hypothetical protein